jgi:hypothetical protein
MSFTPEAMQYIDSRLTELERKITILEKMMEKQYPFCHVTEKVQKPYWSEGGWTCNLCFELMSLCDCKKE